MIDLTIKTLDSQNHAFSVDDDITVAQFKERVAEVINIPVDSQRLIYCGRVLQDNKKLQEYDVHGKVVHLVQRAPPSAGRRTRSPPPSNTTRRPFPGFNGSANAMYLGSMAFPSGLMEAQGIVPPPPTQSLSGSRLNVAKRMLRRAENILNHLEDPQGTRNRESPPEEPQDEVTPVIAAQVFVPESQNDDPLASLSAAVSAVENDILQREQQPDTVPVEVEPADTVASVTVAEPAPAVDNDAIEATASAESVGSLPPSEDAPSASGQGQSAARSRPAVNVTGTGRLPENSSGTIEMARLLDDLNTVHTRLRPFMERYHAFMRDDPAVNSEQIRNTRESQLVINRVSEIMHLLGHAYHSLSDVMVQVSAAPPRPLLCRPILIQHSAVLQAGIPIQVEAQINLTSERRAAETNTNTNTPVQANGDQPPANEVTGTNNTNNGVTPPQPPTPTVHIRPSVHEIRIDSYPIELRSFPRPPIINFGDPQFRRPTTQPTGNNTTAPQPPTTRADAGRTQPSAPTDPNARPSFDAMSPPNMEFFMEVTPESITIDSLGAAVVGPGAPGENVVRGTFGSAPPELIHSILQAVAGQMVGAGVPPPQAQPASTTQAPSTGGDTETPTTESTQANVSQTGGAGTANGTNVNSQARGNTQTHPTTATQTRSTSRPHVHLAQHTMQGFDPFLPCNSHHIRHRRRAAGGGGPNAASTATISVSTETVPAEQQNNNQPPNPVYNLLQGILRTISTANRQQREQAQPDTPAASTPQGTTPPQPQPTTQPSNVTLPPFSTFLTPNMTNIAQGLGTTLLSGLRRITNLAQDLRQLQSMIFGQRNAAHSITLAALLNNFPDHEYTEGESIFNDLIMTLAGELTFGDIIALNAGNFDSLARIRPTLRTFFADRVLQGESPTQAAVERATDRLINELQPTLEIMNTMRVRNNIDIVESVSRLCRSRFLVIISLIMSHGSPANLMDQCLLTIRQLCALVLYSSENGQPGVEEVFKALIGRYTVGVSQDVHQWTVNASLAQFREFMNTLDVPASIIRPYLTTRADAENSQEVTTASASEPEAMECDEVPVTETIVESVPLAPVNATPILDAEPLPNVVIGSESWHRELPADWIPIITRDTQRQRRQNPQPPFSDSYLSGMPSKRRKVVAASKPQGNLPQVISDGVRRAVSSSGLAAAVPLDVVTQAANADTTLQTAYRDFLRSSVQSGLRDNPDFTPERFPNAANYFGIKKE